MQVYAVETRTVKAGDDLVDIVLGALKAQDLELQDKDVLALASKIVSYSQNRIVRLNEIRPSEKAKKLAKQYSLAPEFAELVLREAETIYGGVNKAMLTLKDGTLTPNAGIDSKNAPEGCVVLWPIRLKSWTKNFREAIEHRSGKHVGILVVDSGLTPLRVGTSGLALAVAGLKTIRDHRSSRDLHGRTITITRHAVVDDLASAAHLMMGEATEKTPIVLIREAPLEFDGGAYDAGDMKMPAGECAFMGVFQADSRGSGKAKG